MYANAPVRIFCLFVNGFNIVTEYVDGMLGYGNKKPRPEWSGFVPIGGFGQSSLLK